jgi:hypothetical protein
MHSTLTRGADRTRKCYGWAVAPAEANGGFVWNALPDIAVAKRDALTSIHEHPATWAAADEPRDFTPIS